MNDSDTCCGDYTFVNESSVEPQFSQKIMCLNQSLAQVTSSNIQVCLQHYVQKHFGVFGW